ncbi:hypothetical protein GCM10029963_70430 [Micromonospora andamanensis]
MDRPCNRTDLSPRWWLLPARLSPSPRPKTPRPTATRGGVKAVRHPPVRYDRFAVIGVTLAAESRAPPGGCTWRNRVRLPGAAPPAGMTPTAGRYTLRHTA